MGGQSCDGAVWCSRSAGRGVSRQGYPGDQQLDRLRREVGTAATVVDPEVELVDASGSPLYEIGGRALYHDQHHLTPLGAMLTRPTFEPLFRELAR